jgi:hypothetical protein
MRFFTSQSKGPNYNHEKNWDNHPLKKVSADFAHSRLYKCMHMFMLQPIQNFQKLSWAMVNWCFQAFTHRH